MVSTSMVMVHWWDFFYYRKSTSLDKASNFLTEQSQLYLYSLKSNQNLEMRDPQNAILQVAWLWTIAVKSNKVNNNKVDMLIYLLHTECQVNSFFYIKTTKIDLRLTVLFIQQWDGFKMSSFFCYLKSIYVLRSPRKSHQNDY